MQPSWLMLSKQLFYYLNTRRFWGKKTITPNLLPLQVGGIVDTNFFLTNSSLFKMYKFIRNFRLHIDGSFSVWYMCKANVFFCFCVCSCYISILFDYLKTLHLLRMMDTFLPIVSKSMFQRHSTICKHFY